MSDEADIASRVLHLERELADLLRSSEKWRGDTTLAIDRAVKLAEAVRATACATKADTSEIVQLLKGMRILGALLKWLVAIGLTVGSAYTAGHGLKWW